ncbi:MAG: methyltransferase domain-containing protein, partial [Patescibacteria group bacterium]
MSDSSSSKSELMMKKLNRFINNLNASHNQWLKYIFMNFYWRIDQFVIAIAKKYDQPGKKLLDIGANDCKYHYLFTRLEYFSQDIKQNESKTIDYVVDMADIKSASFDYILCTQVLEHLPDSHQAFREFKRI